LALVLHEQVSAGLRAPEGRGLDARCGHGRHHAGSRAARGGGFEKCPTGKWNPKSYGLIGGDAMTDEPTVSVDQIPAHLDVPGDSKLA